MNHPIQRILVVTKSDDMAASALGAEIAAHLGARGVESDLCEHRPEGCGLTDADVGKFDLILVLGGDGTFIGAARRLHFLKAPLMGVNLGRVGFLTQLHQDRWQSWLKAVLDEGFDVARRLSLTYAVKRGGETVHEGLVINDLVLSRGELARLIRLQVSYDHIPISTLRSDGLIVSTPTGSSAYGISAGGPLVHADLQAYCVTPVCPFLSSFKPMVFPAEGVCTIRVEEKAGEVYLTEDGQAVVNLSHGDEVVIRKAESDLLVVDLGPAAYFEKLKMHGFLTER